MKGSRLTRDVFLGWGIEYALGFGHDGYLHMTMGWSLHNGVIPSLSFIYTSISTFTFLCL